MFGPQILTTVVNLRRQNRFVNNLPTIALAERSSIPIIASGGIAKLADIVDLQAVANTKTGAGIMGVITGRAIYEGILDLTEAQEYCDR